MAGSNVETHVINADDGVKVPSYAQLLDVSGDSSCQNELTITNDMSTSDRSNVLSPRPPDQSAMNQSTTEPSASGLSSQESSVTRTRSRDVMDFAHLKMKLVQLTGPSKEAAGPTTGAAKTKTETDEIKDASVEAVGAVPSPALNAATNSASQVGVGRPVTGQPMVSGNQAVDMQPAAHRGPSLSPEPGSAPAQVASQQTSLPELPVTSAVQRDASIQPVAPTVPLGGLTKVVPSSAEHAVAPVQPVKPVPVYPVSLAQSLPQQKLPVGQPGQVNGSTVYDHMPASMLAPDVQSAMLLQQYQMSSAVPGVVDGASGFAPVQPGVVADMLATSTPASPDGISQVMAAQQPAAAAAEYSPASLLALYNQMMMPLPLMAPAWPALGLNPFLVAANPLLAAQLMYRAPLMPPVSEPVGQIPTADPHLGIPSYPVPGQEHQQPVMPSAVGIDQPHLVRPTSGLPPLAAMPAAGMPLTSMLPVGVTRPLAPRIPVALPGHEQHPAVHGANVPRKRTDRPPHLANLEQALIEKLHGPRKPVPAVQPVHSPAAQSLPGTMGWFQMPYGPHPQPMHTLAAVQSPVVSPLLTADQQQPPGSAFTLAADTALPAGASSTTIPGTSLAAAPTHSGRTTPSVALGTESVPAVGKTAVTLPSAHKLPSESIEAVSASASAADKPVMASSSAAEQMPSKRKLQFTVSAVKDDPLAVNNVQESATACETSTANNEPVSQNPTQNSTSTQNHASLPQESVSTSKAPVKKGRFRISDVKEDTDAGVIGSPLEGSSLPQETVLMSGTRTDASNHCEATAVLTAPELCAQQVCCYYLLYRRPDTLDPGHFRLTKLVLKCLNSYNLAYNCGHRSECPDDCSEFGTGYKESCAWFLGLKYLEFEVSRNPFIFYYCHTQYAKPLFYA